VTLNVILLFETSLNSIPEEIQHVLTIQRVYTWSESARGL